MTAQILPAESCGLTQVQNSSGVSQHNPDIIRAVNVKRRGSATCENYAGQYVLRPNLPRHCLAAGYAASCPSVKSNLIALYGNTIFPWSSWSIAPAFNSACTSRCTPRKSRPTRRDNSRIDIAPAPVMALITCRRPAPSMVFASDSISGNVRENGTSTACPDIAATKDFEASSNDSLTGITRTTSVLMTLPPDSVHIVKKLADKVIQPGERNGKFRIANMLVISFSGFIVVAHNAYILNDISEAVFVVVLASPDGWINRPYGNAGKSFFIREVVTFFNEQISRHLLSPFSDDNYSININMMSMMPVMSSKALDRLNCWRYSYSTPHKTGAGRCNPNMYRATPDARGVFFVVCYMCDSMAWYAIQQGSYNRRSPALLSYHAANNGAVYCLSFGVSLPLLVRVTVISRVNSTSRRQRMVTLAGQPQGWPVPLYAGIATPVNDTAPAECGNSSGDSVNVRGGRLMATTPAQNMLFVWRFWSVQNSTYLTTTAASEREARSQLPAVIARIRMEVQHDA